MLLSVPGIKLQRLFTHAEEIFLKVAWIAFNCGKFKSSVLIQLTQGTRFWKLPEVHLSAAGLNLQWSSFENMECVSEIELATLKCRSFKPPLIFELQD